VAGGAPNVQGGLGGQRRDARRWGRVLRVPRDPARIDRALTLYGLVADPAQVAQQMEALAGSLPEQAQPLIADQHAGGQHAYDEDDEERGFLKLRGTALLLTLGAVVFVLVTRTLVAVVPPLLEALQLGVVGTVIAQVVRWGLLIAIVVITLAAVYRVAPARDAPRFRWVSRAPSSRPGCGCWAASGSAST
jgi:membrane protein